MSVAIETVESTTEQLYIENNSVDMGRWVYSSGYIISESGTN